jgi:phage baseplate assembly protein W
MGTTLSLPFSFNIAGSVNTTVSPQRQWADRVLGVIFTTPGERVMQPFFGSDTKGAVFEPEGAVVEYIKRTVTSSFGQFLPELTLRNVFVTKEESELDYEALVVSVDYELPNKEQASVTAKIGTFSRTGELIQEIANG